MSAAELLERWEREGGNTLRIGIFGLHIHGDGEWSVTFPGNCHDMGREGGKTSAVAAYRASTREARLDGARELVEMMRVDSYIGAAEALKQMEDG